METHLVQSFSILFLAIVASHAAVDPEVYFKSMLPNTPIPKAIKDSLSNGRRSASYAVGKPKANFPYYEDAATDEQIMGMRMASLFIREEEMRAGKSINLHISKDTTATPQFVPRQIADSLPIASNKLQDIYKAFKVRPESLEGKLIKTTVNECEKASNLGQDQSCVTSLESMVDFATSKLGKRIKAISTHVDGHESTTLQGYKVKEVRKLKGDTTVVVCHQEYYGYAVHVCHKSPKVSAYVVSLVGENNVKAKAISVCHEDTSSWNPEHLAFQLLKLSPGKDAVCHFLVEDGLVWIPY